MGIFQLSVSIRHTLTLHVEVLAVQRVPVQYSTSTCAVWLEDGLQQPCTVNPGVNTGGTFCHGIKPVRSHHAPLSLLVPSCLQTSALMEAHLHGVLAACLPLLAAHAPALDAVVPARVELARSLLVDGNSGGGSHGGGGRMEALMSYRSGDALAALLARTAPQAGGAGLVPHVLMQVEQQLQEGQQQETDVGEIESMLPMVTPAVRGAVDCAIYA